MELLRNEPILQRAYDFAKHAHEGQTRSEGTPYISHPEAVARIISEEWGITDTTMVAAAYLHDTIEDSLVTKEDIASSFGSQIAEMVEGVSKFRSQEGTLSKDDVDRETLKKIAGRNLINPRDVVLKLADRLHNMRTLHFVPLEKQIPKANETMDVYVPLAESLGMWKVKSELEDLAFKYLAPGEFKHFEDLMEGDKRLGDLFREHMVSSIESLIGQSGVQAHVETRVNSLARIKHKMDTAPDLTSINDIISFRVVVDDSRGYDASRDDSYKILGRIREIFQSEENTERFDDFFVQPTDNGYSTIQITLNSPHGAVEIAVATTTKEEFNNWGVVSLIKKGQADLKDYVLKVIFTPTGKVKFLPKEATGIDLAYSIDPVMGVRAVNLLIDGKPFPVSANLPNGALVEVILGKASAVPPQDYLNYCMPKTKKIIENQIAENVRRGLIKKGRELATIEASRHGFKNFEELLETDEYAQKLVGELYLHGFKGRLNNLYFTLGAGRKDEEFLIKIIRSVISE